MKAFAYARFSSDNQREESIDAQLRAIREYADKNDIEIIREFTDEAKSGTSNKRPGFLQMFEDLTLFRPQLIIVHKLDRFSRDRYDSAYYRRIIKKSGAKLVSVLEPLDDSPESIILESVLEGMAEYYSKNLARETLKGLKETAYKCEHTGGLPPLGYDVESRKYIINHSEAEIVRTIFRMYADGKSYDRIIEELKGAKTKAGKPFGKNSLNSILNNEKYRGVFTFGRQKRSNHNSHADNTEVIRIENGMPRIIDESTWNAVQERIHNNKRNASYKAKRVYLLSGKLVCQKCRAMMVGTTTTNRKGYEYMWYGCSNKYRTKSCDQQNIPAEKIESSVLDLIEERLKPDEKLIEEVMRILNTDSPEMEEDLKELRDLEQRSSRLIALVESGANVPAVSERITELSEKEKALRQKIAEARSEEVDYSTVKEFLLSMSDLKSLPREQQKEIINRVVDKIEVSETQFKIEFRIPKVAGESNISYRKIILCREFLSHRC